MARQQEDPVTTSRLDESTSSTIVFVRAAELPVLAIPAPAAPASSAPASSAPAPSASAPSASAAVAPAAVAPVAVAPVAPTPVGPTPVATASVAPPPVAPPPVAPARQAVVRGQATGPVGVKVTAGPEPESVPGVPVTDEVGVRPGDEVPASPTLGSENLSPEPVPEPVVAPRSEPQPVPVDEHAPVHDRVAVLEPVRAHESEPVWVPSFTAASSTVSSPPEVAVRAASASAGTTMARRVKLPGPRRVSQNAVIAGGALLFLGTSVVVAAAAGGIPGADRSGHGGRSGLALPAAVGSSPAPTFSNLVPVTGTPTPSVSPPGVKAPKKASRKALSATAGKKKAASASAALAAATTTTKATRAKASTKQATHVKAKAKAKKKVVSRPSAGTSYKLYNVATGKCIGPLGSPDTQVACGSAVHLKLQKTRTVNGVPLYWLREASGSRDCIDLPNYGSEPETTPLSVYTCTTPASSDNQEWKLNDIGVAHNGHEEYALVNYATSECLDVAYWASDGSDAPSGRALTIYQCHSSSWGWDDHRWVFES